MPAPAVAPALERGLVVVGTDTGVGKTVVAAACLWAGREAGRPALGFKPVESGVDPLDPASGDAAVLARAGGVDEPLARPLLRLREPLTPALAAEREGRALDPRELRARLAALRAAGRWLVVEGAGGLLSPLAWGYDTLDLALDAGLPALIVAPAGLGALNQVRLTWRALAAAGVPLAGVVLNGARQPPTLAEATNPGVLARLLPPGTPLVCVPRQAAEEALDAARLTRVHIAPLLAHG